MSPARGKALMAAKLTAGGHFLVSLSPKFFSGLVMLKWNLKAALFEGLEPGSVSRQTHGT